jgi:hypothetical protein
VSQTGYHVVGTGDRETWVSPSDQEANEAQEWRYDYQASKISRSMSQNVQHPGTAPEHFKRLPFVSQEVMNRELPASDAYPASQMTPRDAVLNPGMARERDMEGQRHGDWQRTREHLGRGGSPRAFAGRRWDHLGASPAHGRSKHRHSLTYAAENPIGPHYGERAGYALNTDPIVDEEMEAQFRAEMVAILAMPADEGGLQRAFNWKAAELMSLQARLCE